MADRDANRITITARNVTQLSLFLNDALVDLDKEFTVVINGKAVTETRTRNFFDMTEWLYRRFDSSYIFTTSYTTTVPKPTDDGEG